jgi:hypothetical protein
MSRSFLDRLTRAFSTLSHVELDDRAKIGALDEQYAAQVIYDSEGSWIRNPIIPHPTKLGYNPPEAADEIKGLFVQQERLLFPYKRFSEGKEL